MIGLIRRHKIISVLLVIASIFFYNNYLRPISGNASIDKNSIFYINNLYQSDGLHYNSLSEPEKELYNKLVKSYMKFEKDIKMDIKSFGCNNFDGCNIPIFKVWDSIMIDHPELLQLSTVSYQHDRNSSMIDIQLDSGLYFNFQYTFGIMRIERIIDKIKKETNNMSDKEKVKYVYEWIGKNTKYDKLFTSSSKNQSAYSAFIDHSGVCAAYAKASQIIFQNIGIKSYIVRGRSTGEHMWNIVKIEDKYYFYDSTVASATEEDNNMFYRGLLQSYVGGFTVYNKELYPQTSNEEFFE